MLLNLNTRNIKLYLDLRRHQLSQLFFPGNSSGAQVALLDVFWVLGPGWYLTYLGHIIISEYYLLSFNYNPFTYFAALAYYTTLACFIAFACSIALENPLEHSNYSFPLVDSSYLGSSYSNQVYMHLLFISLTFITVSYTDYNYLVIDPYQLFLNFAYLIINSHEIQITLHSTFLLMF